MNSLQILNAVLLAVAAAFAVTMGVVTLLYAVYLGSEPRLHDEWPVVRNVTQVFAVLTLLSGGTFYAQRRRLRWRWLAQALMAGGFLGGGWFLFRTLS